jgi:YesN/AraC family two-component response regulator
LIRVALVENETLVREGLRRVLMLDSDLSVVGEARDGIEALELVGHLRPEVVLLDMRMPRLDGLGVVERTVKNSSPASSASSGCAIAHAPCSRPYRYG